MKVEKNEGSISQTEMRHMVRNLCTMKRKKQRRIGILILVGMFPRTIKGKLGFNIRTNDGIFLGRSQAIYTALADDVNGYFAIPFVEMPAFDALNGAMKTALADIPKGIPGAVGAKNAAKNNLMSMLRRVLAYVNGLALVKSTIGESIITGAKMLVNKEREYNKQDFTVTPGPGAGEMTLRSLAAKINSKYVRTFYGWRYSADNGNTWIDLPTTGIAKLIAKNLPTKIILLFQKRTTNRKGGTSQWCDAKPGTAY